MSSLKRVKINYCNARINENPSSGPIIINDNNAAYAIIGTMKGNIIRIPLIFGPSKDYRGEYSITQLNASATINLKELFLDQETASSVIGLGSLGDGKMMVALLDGKIFEVSENSTRLIFEFDSTLSTSPAVVGEGASARIVVPTTEGILYLINLKGQIIAKEILESTITAKPLFVASNNALLIGGSKGEIICHNYAPSSNEIRRAWQFNAHKAITTEIISTELMNDGRVFYLFGSADRNVYCLSEDGVMAWRFPTSGRIISGVYIDDINNDGVKEIVFGSCDDKVYVLSAYGNEIWNYETDFWVAATPAVLDVDDDRYKEVFVGSYDNSLYCFSPEADFVPNFFSGASGIVQQSATFEHADAESSAGYFARKLFQEQMDGMIIGIHALESMKILAAITNKGEFRSFQFENI
jgi:outer membrane protein assembly factor BamB